MSPELPLRFYDVATAKQKVAFVSGLHLIMMKPDMASSGGHNVSSADEGDLNSTTADSAATATEHRLQPQHPGNLYATATARLSTAGHNVRNSLSASSGSKATPHVVISYGVADWLSRVLALNLHQVEALFAAAPTQVQTDAGLLRDAINRRQAGAALLYWHLRKCGAFYGGMLFLQAGYRVVHLQTQHPHPPPHTHTYTQCGSRS